MRVSEVTAHVIVRMVAAELQNLSVQTAQNRLE